MRVCEADVYVADGQDMLEVENQEPCRQQQASGEFWTPHACYMEQVALQVMQPKATYHIPGPTPLVVQACSRQLHRSALLWSPDPRQTPLPGALLHTQFVLV